MLLPKPRSRALALATILILCACSDDEDSGSSDADEQSAPPGMSQQGEACQKTADCVTGLACVAVSDTLQACEPAGTAPYEPVLGNQGDACQSNDGCATGLVCVSGQCWPSELRAMVLTNKECAAVQCATARDCCPANAANCNTDGFACVQGTCHTACLENADCAADAPVCASGACVQCAVDGDCASSLKCVDFACTAPCRSDSSCPPLSACQDGVCNEVGCQSDRECVAALNSILAVCNPTLKECFISCQTDLQCLVQTKSAWNICVDNYCQDAGCETDQECKARVTVTAATPLAVCRDKATP